MQFIECPRCEGTGEIEDFVSSVNPTENTTQPCWLCLGEAEITDSALRDYEEYLAECERYTYEATARI